MFLGAKLALLLLLVASRIESRRKEYDTKEIRRIISIACSGKDFSEVEIDLERNCPEIVRKRIKKTKDSLNDYKLKNDFRKEIGENVEITEDKTSNRRIKVDLNTVLEKYTKYDGAVIWDEIHRIASLSQPGQTNQPMPVPVSILPILISGVHCSITIHLCVFFSDDPGKSSLYVNKSLLKKRVLTEHFNNLKYTLDFLISLLPVALDEIKRVTRSKEGEISVGRLEEEIKRLPKFNYLSYGRTNGLLSLSKEIVGLIGCVDCLRCQVWGKIQFEGIACAIKLLMRGQREKVKITSFEIISYVNLLNRLNTSVTQYNRYLDTKK